MEDNVIRRALISVYDKTGIGEFAAALAGMGVEIISSGGTARAIEAAGVKVRQVQEWTGFPEMLGHRVVTLHPKVHGGILALRDDPDHQADIEKYGLELVDLVCVGLYPFEQAVAGGAAPAEAVEMIDIGGPTMVRAAAKNHRFVTVVTAPSQYQLVLDEMRSRGGSVSFETRLKLAQSAFSLTMAYDAAISNYLAGQMGIELPERLGLAYTKARELRYGENSHQKAAFYVGSDQSETSVSTGRLLGGGKAISFNNYFDTNAAQQPARRYARLALVGPDVEGRLLMAVLAV
ncbi:MAG: bifunctional phosphoribosylaminoimidazolecarboxamide formyltransferase/IMP cyclohydrolase, partial [Planctomycetes bacterium]|nr:bifunctional phosphoribosylaminoimidazolecarboxamide formyltransferase/IMP cyclohydrolase [Planctomycetota bacterium]